ncbi:uncharacterized protein ACNS7B_014351 isoform 2-T2 [Menidia menidia]
MVSKEPNRPLTGQANGKSALADKLPGAMTVRSVLLNRDSPDIESRLKRRRNRTHQVRFKDLEDGSSSSGNSGTGENNGHPRPSADPLRKPGGGRPQPWAAGSIADGLPGQTSVVGAVRGDMASTIEKVAAFLARAPPHPLTPGPTRRCWAPPQANSLTLPMTRRPSTSTSTGIQTSPCLRKHQALSSARTGSHNVGDSVGVDGDDEHDSQDEYLTHNHVSLPGSRDQSRPTTPVDRTVVERRSKATRADCKSAVTVKSSRHSCPPSVLHIGEPRHCSSVPSREGAKRPGSSTPAVVRRRKRLNRTSSDPGKEVHYCTTPTQTDSPCPSPPPSNAKLCTTQVQTESPFQPPDSNSKYHTAQSQTENQHRSPALSEEQRTTQVETNSPSPALPPAVQPCDSQTQKDSPGHSPPNREPGTPPPSPASPISEQIQPDSPSATRPAPTAETKTVPYCNSPPPASATFDHRKPPCSSPSKPASIPLSPPEAPCLPSSTSAPPVTQCQPPPTTPNTTVVGSSLASNAPTCPKQIPTANPAPSFSSTGSTSTPTDPVTHPVTPPNITHEQTSSVSNASSPSPPTPCTFVTQTALSCTSISYYTTTHPACPHVPHLNSTSPSYATIIQTVSHCNIPCQALQSNSPVSTGITPYSSPVPKLKTCTSPPPLVKTYVSTLQGAPTCPTPTKAVPLYSSTFRAAPPYTPPSQAPYNAQDKRGIRLPPPPPPPPPYTPRKKGSEPQGKAVRTPMLRAESKAGEKDKDKEREKEKKEDMKRKDSPRLCERASSLKHRAQTPPVAVMKGERRSSASSPAKACFKPSCLSSAQAQLGVLHKMLCSGANARPNTPNSQHTLPQNQQGCSGARGCSASGDRPTAGPLTPTQADTLRQVQEILGGLMSGARCKLDPSRVTEKLLSPNGPLHDIRSLQNQLHSLEGVLETSQNTIKVLLDVIQDLEKKEAERDGHSYRTGQDIENCGTCRDCACIIYSVEHDFRLQEGQVVRTWKVGDPPEGSPPTTGAPPPARRAPPAGPPHAGAPARRQRQEEPQKVLLVPLRRFDSITLFPQKD